MKNICANMKYLEICKNMQEFEDSVIQTNPGYSAKVRYCRTPLPLKQKKSNFAEPPPTPLWWLTSYVNSPLSHIFLNNFSAFFSSVIQPISVTTDEKMKFHLFNVHQICLFSHCSSRPRPLVPLLQQIELSLVQVPDWGLDLSLDSSTMIITVHGIRGDELI